MAWRLPTGSMGSHLQATEETIERCQSLAISEANVSKHYEYFGLQDPRGPSQQDADGAVRAQCWLLDSSHGMDVVADSMCEAQPADAQGRRFGGMMKVALYKSVLKPAQCVNCPLSKYQSASASSSCLDCAAGLFTQSAGAVNCTGCPAGKFLADASNTSPEDGETGSTVRCEECPVSKYQSSTGALACDDCPNGHETNGTGSLQASGCIACDAGKFHNGEPSFSEDYRYVTEEARRAVKENPRVRLRNCL